MYIVLLVYFEDLCKLRKVFNSLIFLFNCYDMINKICKIVKFIFYYELYIIFYFK